MSSAYKNSSKWVKRMEEFFIQSDLNKDGHLSIEDFDMWSDNLEREVKAAPELLEKSRRGTHEFWVSAGLNPGVFLTKDQFIDNMSELSAAENARLEKGEEPLFFKWMDAVFDAVDTNRDGYLQLDEYEKMMKAGNFDTGTAKIVFDMIDTNHDSKLSRQELKDHNIRFWFTPDDPKAAGLFGPKFE